MPPCTRSSMIALALLLVFSGNVNSTSPSQSVTLHVDNTFLPGDPLAWPQNSSIDKNDRWYSGFPCATEDVEEDQSYGRSAFLRIGEDAVRFQTTVPAFGKVLRRSSRSEPSILESETFPCSSSNVSSQKNSFQCKAQKIQRPASFSKPSVSVAATKNHRGGASNAAPPLKFWENMVCGAMSRSVAQTIMHPANTMKTILQSERGVSTSTYQNLLQPSNFRRLTQGAGANFILSVPHGAINFAVLEFVRSKLARVVQANDFLNERSTQLGPGLDFFSSCISTITCSVVSTPQMMITDNIMAGNYPNLPAAISGLWSSRGIKGFYQGWWPGLVGKIPSYALTWTFFQQLKEAHTRITQRPAKNIENSMMGSLASATTVCIMIPMDTIKTRLVTQSSSKIAPELAYKGIIDCALRVYKEEGLATFYKGLPPRLVSVVPMIGIQFGVYEFAKRVMLERRQSPKTQTKGARETDIDEYGPEEVLKEAAMEVAASPEHPYPAPRFHNLIKPLKQSGRKTRKKNATVKERTSN